MALLSVQTNRITNNDLLYDLLYALPALSSENSTCNTGEEQ